MLLRLYIAGTSLHSTRAIQNARKLCDEHLSGRYQLEVIDIFQQPALAKDHQILAVPTLITGYYGMNVPYPGSGETWGMWA
ncbi:MAG: circadian clock KaiB family protein, partial [Kofleriaceae bacterium]